MLEMSFFKISPREVVEGKGVAQRKYGMKPEGRRCAVEGR